MRADVRYQVLYDNVPEQGTDEYNALMKKMSADVHELRDNIVSYKFTEGDRAYYNALSKVYSALRKGDDGIVCSIDPQKVDYAPYKRISNTYGLPVTMTVSRSGRMFGDVRNILDPRYYNRVVVSYEPGNDHDDVSFMHEDMSGFLHESDPVLSFRCAASVFKDLAPEFERNLDVLMTRQSMQDAEEGHVIEHDAAIVSMLNPVHAHRDFGLGG